MRKLINLISRLWYWLFPKDEVIDATDAKPIKVTSVVHDKDNNTFDITYETDAQPGDLVSVDISGYIEIP